MQSTWYIIVNPTSGNGAANKKWKKIRASLKNYNIQYDYSFSEYKTHEQLLVNEALEKGYRKFISVGGDGTLHHVVNGLMNQKHIDHTEVKIGVIALGTGNDWIKTYKIPKNIKKAIAIISNGNSTSQDIGYIQLLNTDKNLYFNNLAGLGFDGFVIKNSIKYKKLGVFAYLTATLVSFIKYRKSVLNIEFNNLEITTKSLLTLVGICKYSGSGMKLTSNVDTTDNLFDISIVKNFNFLSVILNILKFYNGKITNHKEVENHKTSLIKIIAENKNTFIQADGELIGTGGFEASIIPKALQFIVP